MYSLASVLTALNLFVWQHPDLDNDLWTFVLRTYLAGSLLGSLLLLLANYRAQTPRIRTQLRTIVVCSGGTIGINVLLFAVASLVPAPWRHSIENAGVFAALLSPISYAYSMLRYDVLIEGVLGRRWLIRCLTVSLFLLLSGWGWLFVVRYPVALNDTVALGLILAIGSVLLGVITTTVGEWLEARVLRGHTDVDLLDYATRELGSFHKLDEFVQFLTTALPKRLHSIGCLVFLATESGGLVLRGSSPTMTNLHPQEEFSITPCSDISTIMQHTHHPIPLDTLAITSTPFSAEDSLLLAALRTARIALLVPLVSSQQGRVIGLIAVGVKETDEPYSPQEIAALSALARAAAASAQNVLLFDTLQQQIQALSEEREDRLALARQINVEQEAVRKRISRDLHDRPVQELSVLKRALTALREDVESWIAEFEDRSSALEGSSAGSTRQSLLEVLLTERRRLEILLGEDVSLLANVSLEKQPTVEGLISQAATTLTMLRGICDDLHPGFLSGSLRKILNDSIARAMKRHPQIKFILETPGQEGEDFPDELKEACKEIVDQAIHNAVVHGLATQIKVHLKHTSEGIVLTVSDNGCGFIPSPPRKLRAGGHHGVANMTERAELLGGLLQITSRLDQGTQVEATFQRNAIPVVPTSKPHTLLGRSLLPRSSTEATLHH